METFSIVLSNNRVPYLISVINVIEEKVITKPYKDGKEFTEIIFVKNPTPLDVLDIFHAGVKCGEQTILNALQSRKRSN